MQAIERFRGQKLIARFTELIGHDRAGFIRHVDLAPDPLHLGQRLGLVDDGEGLRDDEFVRHLQHGVEHPRSRNGRVLAYRNDGAVSRFARERPANFQRIRAEEQPLRRQRLRELHARQCHRPRKSAIDELHQEFQRLGMPNVTALDDGENPRAIRLQALSDGFHHVREFDQRPLLARRATVRSPSSQKLADHEIRRPDRALQLAPHDGQVDIVHKHSLGAQGRRIALVQLLAELILEARLDRGLHLAAHDMRVDRIAGIRQPPNEIVAAEQARIDLGDIDRLEAQSAHVNEGHQHAVVRLDHLVGHMPRIGYMGRNRLLPTRHGPETQFIAKSPCDRHGHTR